MAEFFTNVPLLCMLAVVGGLLWLCFKLASLISQSGQQNHDLSTLLAQALAGQQPISPKVISGVAQPLAPPVLTPPQLTPAKPSPSAPSVLTGAQKWPQDNQPALIAFYGDPAQGEVDPQLIHVVPPFRMTYEGAAVPYLLFHKKAADALIAALNTVWNYYGHDQAKLDALGISKTAGTYNKRVIAGTNRWSNHAFGAAIDINAEENGFNVAGNIPRPMIAAFKAQGARWGGDYHGRTDPMHFEFCESGEPRQSFEAWLAHYGASPAGTAPATPAAAPGGIQTNIIATMFGSQENDNRSTAYGGPLNDNLPGVALPFHFPSPRPRVRVTNAKTGASVDCDVVDVGPWNINDPYWKTDARPQAESGMDLGQVSGGVPRHTNGAGIDLTSAAAIAIGLPGKGFVNWNFIESAPAAPPATPNAT